MDNAHVTPASTTRRVPPKENAPLFRGTGECEPCPAGAGDYETGDHLPTRVFDGAPGRQQLGGAATKPASSNRREYSP